MEIFFWWIQWSIVFSFWQLAPFRSFAFMNRRSGWIWLRSHIWKLLVFRSLGRGLEKVKHCYFRVSSNRLECTFMESSYAKLTHNILHRQRCVAWSRLSIKLPLGIPPWWYLFALCCMLACLKFNILFRAKHVPDVKNIRADALSHFHAGFEIPIASDRERQFLTNGGFLPTSTAQLAAITSTVLQSSLQPSSVPIYHRAWRLYQQFAHEVCHSAV